MQRCNLTSFVLLAAARLVAQEPAAAPTGLAARIEAVMARPEFAPSTFGIHVARAGSGQVLYAHNADKLLAPASTTKLVSCAGALLLLGKDHRFETRVAGTGPVIDGALHGDLVLVAAGDPNLSQRLAPDGKLRFRDKDHSYAGFYDAELVDGDPLAVLKGLAQQVAASGVREIRGDVAVDDGLFSETDDDFVGPVSAACVNDNLLDAVVAPGEKAGDLARAQFQPRGSLVELVVTARTSAEGTPVSLELVARPGVLSFELRGSIPIGSAPIVRVAAFQRPAAAAASFLADALREAGIAVRGKTLERRLGPAAYESSRQLALHTSPPLSEALRVILKVSHNLHATMLPPLLGALHGGSADRWGGYRAIGAALEKAGLDAEAVTIHSGSGGSRGDHLSARWTVELLRFLARHPDFPIFLDALPIGGVDGTLATAFTDKELGARIHAKTGTLVYRGALGQRWVFVSKALAGYVDLRSRPVGPAAPDDLLAFSIIIANTPVEDRARGTALLFRAQEDILRAVHEAAAGAAGTASRAR
jgi:D-alanyl-D-alanine carboxypeptidase/D-alanyl-D-alanine-endopeptidase (penicillin-binding protein 4)